MEHGKHQDKDNTKFGVRSYVSLAALAWNSLLKNKKHESDAGRNRDNF